EAAHRRENLARKEEAHPVHRRDLGHRGTHRRLPVESVHDGPAHVAPVATHAPHPVEPGQPYPPGSVHRGLQTLEPPRLAHHGVVVEEAEAVAAGQAGALVERADEPHVLPVAVVPQRGRARAVAEEGLGAVGRGVVDDAQLERAGGRPKTLEAGARERELVVDDEHDAGAHRAPATAAAGYRSESGTYLRSIAPV